MHPFDDLRSILSNKKSEDLQDCSTTLLACFELLKFNEAEALDLSTDLFEVAKNLYLRVNQASKRLGKLIIEATAADDENNPKALELVNTYLEEEQSLFYKKIALHYHNIYKVKYSDKKIGFL